MDSSRVAVSDVEAVTDQGRGDIDEASYIGELIARLATFLVSDVDDVSITHERVGDVVFFRLTVSDRDLSSILQNGLWHITDLENLLLGMGRKSKLKCRLAYSKRPEAMRR